MTSNATETICPRCGEPTSDGYKKCYNCRQSQQRYNHDHRERRKAKGACVHCGNQAAPGHTRCEPCGEKHNQDVRARKSSKSESTICIRKGCTQPKVGKQFCHDHLEQERHAAKERSNKKRSQGNQDVPAPSPHTTGPSSPMSLNRMVHERDGAPGNKEMVEGAETLMSMSLNRMEHERDGAPGNK